MPFELPEDKVFVLWRPDMTDVIGEVMANYRTAWNRMMSAVKNQRSKIDRTRVATRRGLRVLRVVDQYGLGWDVTEHTVWKDDYPEVKSENPDADVQPNF